MPSGVAGYCSSGDPACRSCLANSAGLPKEADARRIRARLGVVQ